MTAGMARRLAAELVGTLLLVLFGAGSFVAALAVVKGGDLSYPAIGIIAFSFAIVVAAAVYVFGPVSGAHINPAVTVALAVVRKFPWREVVPYIVAQLVGAVIGAVLVNVIFGPAATDYNVSGGTMVGEGYGSGQALLAEVLGTALLLFAVMAMAVDKRAPRGWAGLIIGLAVGCEIMVIGPISNGSVNPARTLGPYVATTLFGGSTPWSQFWIYVVGPLLGAIVAALVYQFIAQPDAEEKAEQQAAQNTAESVGNR